MLASNVHTFHTLVHTLRSNKPVDSWGKRQTSRVVKFKNWKKDEDRREEKVVPFEAFTADVEIKDDEFEVDATASTQIEKAGLLNNPAFLSKVTCKGNLYKLIIPFPIIILIFVNIY